MVYFNHQADHENMIIKWDTNDLVESLPTHQITTMASNAVT